MKKENAVWCKYFLRLFGMFMLTGAILISVTQLDRPEVKAKEIDCFTVEGNDIHLIERVIKSQGLPFCLSRVAEYTREHADGTIKYTVKVPEGTYEMMGTVGLGWGMKLDLTGVTLVATYKNNMMTMRYMDQIYGYGDDKTGNVEVCGGTFIGNDQSSASMIRIAHARNIKFSDCTFVGGGCAHQMEIAAIDGFILENCVFRDAKGNGTNEKQEALQFDIPCSQYVYKAVTLDGTPMKNVTVSGCTFRNVLRGLGSHSMLVGTYHENMNIVNNTFENVDGECIVGLNYKNCKITGNKVKNSGAGILVQNFKPNAKAVYTTIYDGTQKVDDPINNVSNIEISDNTISLSANKHPDEFVGIKVYGYNLKKGTYATGIGSNDFIAKADFCVDGVIIKNNRITTNGHGIHLLHVSNADIGGNKIKSIDKKSNRDGIFAESECKNLSIHDNQISDASRYGIFVKDSSTIKRISKNMVKGTGSFGIGLYEGTQVTGAITYNKISNTKAHGISVSKRCYVKEISHNTVKGSKEYPIFINTTSKKKIVIKNNSLQKGKNKKTIVIMNGNVNVK